MNLIVIGNNTDKIALDIWRGNTNYIVLNKNPYIWNKEYDKFAKGKDVLISTTFEQFEDKKINDVIDLFKTKKFIPVFIADNIDSLESKAYSAICDFIPSALLYIKNEKNEDYKELLRIAKGYLLGKGIIEDDKTIRTPRKRKTTTTKK